MLNVKNGNLIINIGIEILVNVQKFFECYFYYFFKECVVLFLTLFFCCTKDLLVWVLQLQCNVTFQH